MYLLFWDAQIVTFFIIQKINLSCTFPCGKYQVVYFDMHIKVKRAESSNRENARDNDVK